MEQVSLDNVLAATGGRWNQATVGPIDFGRIVIDSREVQSGDLFWTVSGERQDGHDFVGDAFRRGAVASVVQRKRLPGQAWPLIEVPDTLRALWDFASWYRQQQQQARVIAVTGSVGKTTTREMIYAVLSTLCPGTRSPRNYNNHFGVPLSLLQIERVHEFAVVELGASQVGEIRDLAGIAAPQIGVVTAVAPSHLQSFGNVDRIAQAKGELVESLPSGGLAILNGDDGAVRQMAGSARCRVVLVGQSRANDVRAEDVCIDNHRLSFRVERQTYEVNTPARYHLTAALAAIAVGQAAGMETVQIAAGLKAFKPRSGRCRIEQIGPWTVIDDTYNANPASMQAACTVLRDWDKANKKVLVVGDMLELGDRSAQWHGHLGRTAAAAGIDRLLAYGRQGRHVIDGARDGGMPAPFLAHCEQPDTALEILGDWLEPQDVVLVKGSRGMKMEYVVEWLRRRSDHDTQENSARAQHEQASNAAVLLPA